MARSSDSSSLLLAESLGGGSGSTLIACEQLQRRGLLMELDPAYCDVIVERWEKFTGRQAERIAAVEVTA